MAMPITVSLAAIIVPFSDSLKCSTSFIIFCEILEDAAKSCESAVDIVHANIPAKIIPAGIMASIPCLLKICEI